MSSANLDLVLSISFERDEFDERIVERFDPAIVLDNSTLPAPTAGVYRGHEGLRQLQREWLEAFETHHIDAERFIDAGDVIVVGYRVTGRGKASGAAVEMHRWNVYRIRNGLVIRIDMFETKTEALEAAGLPEDAHASS
jgi:ketosteroid isomerase-like protein